MNDIENGHWEIKDIIAITEILGDPICFHLSVLQDNKDHLGNASHYIETPSHYQVSLCFTWNRIDVFQCYTIVYKQWEEAGKIKNKHNDNNEISEGIMMDDNFFVTNKVC